jgi:hypothetical protein
VDVPVLLSCATSVPLNGFSYRGVVPTGVSPLIRGIYDDGWTVPRFATKEEAAKWYGKNKRVTNPKYGVGDHIFTHACDWEQVQSLLLGPLAYLRKKVPVRPAAALPASNRFSGEKAVVDEINKRLDLPFHAATTEESTMNTLRYLFWHMRCGIFVTLRRNRLAMFVPFVNKDYVNTWGKQLRLEEPLTEYYAKKSRLVKEKYLPQKTRWWANGNIICNVPSKRFWGDSYLPQLRDMLLKLCAEREVADCEFFINKRDFPHLKADLSEPYDFVFDEAPQPLPRELYTTYAPIASFFVSSTASFADLPLVTTDDWETATGAVFPPHFVDLRSASNRSAHDVEWSERVATAIFRGNATGPGVTPHTNQRLALAELSFKWAHDPLLADGNPVDGVRFLDAGVVGINLRDRKMKGRPMTYIKKEVRLCPP